MTDLPPDPGEAWAAERIRIRRWRDTHSIQTGERTDRRTGQTHGLRSTYSAGCRCDLCRSAAAEASRVRRAKLKAQREAGR